MKPVRNLCRAIEQLKQAEELLQNNIEYIHLLFQLYVTENVMWGFADFNIQTNCSTGCSFYLSLVKLMSIKPHIHVSF